MLYSPPGEEEFFQSNAPYSQYSPEELLKISQSISRACTLFPQGPTCLIKALAGRQMLVQRRLPFELKLGVKKGEEETKFEFHAWLVAGETCITGEETKHQFAPFSTK